MIIRKYKLTDRTSVEYIQFETYFLGKSGSYLATSPKLFNKELSYYFDKEPQSIFVAEDKGKVVGYLLGCLDDKNHNESALSYIGIMFLKMFQLPFMNPIDRKFWKGAIKMVFAMVLESMKGSGYKTPENAGHLHINLLPETRGKGVGTKLLKEFFKYAKLKGVKTIHADSWQTRLNPNKNFWIKNGFKEYSKAKTIFWKEYYPKEEMHIVCYVKKL